jgi:hypothetical protein
MLITNDLDNGTADIYEAALPEGRIITLEPGQSLADATKRLNGAPLVIDFGGFVESRIIEAATMADVTVVPLSYQSTADLMPAVKTVSALQPYCANIIILINNTAPEHVAGLQQVLGSRFPKVPVLIVNHSRYISRIADDGLTLFDLAELGGLERYQLRNILPQVEALYRRIDKHNDRTS